MATRAGMNGLYLWYTIYILKKDRQMKYDCLGSVPGRETCMDIKTQGHKENERNKVLFN